MMILIIRPNDVQPGILGSNSCGRAHKSGPYDRFMKRPAHRFMKNFTRLISFFFAANNITLYRVIHRSVDKYFM